MGPGTEHEAAMLEVLEPSCKKTGKAAGKHCGSGVRRSPRASVRAFQFLALSSDAGLMGKAAREEFGAIDFSGQAVAAEEKQGSLY